MALSQAGHAPQPETEIEGLATLFRALADPARLRILNLLARGDEVSGRAVEAVTGYGASKISRHFAYLKQAGLVRDRREGLWIYYSLRPSTGAARAKLDRVIADLPQYYELLAEDTARLSRLAAKSERTEAAASGVSTAELENREVVRSTEGGAMFGIRPKKAVLFLCQSNAARSQMAEAFLRKYGGDQFEVFSAGLMAGEIHPFTRQVLSEVGLNIGDQRAKGVNEYLGRKAFAYVITLCLEAEEECPRMFPGSGEIKQWPFEDVANAKLPDVDKLARFRIVRDRIEHKVKEWLKD